MSRYQKLLHSPLYLDLNMKQMFIEKQYTYRVETIVSQNDGVTVYNHDSQIGSWYSTVWPEIQGSWFESHSGLSFLLHNVFRTVNVHSIHWIVNDTPEF